MSLNLIRRYTPMYSKVLPGYHEVSEPIWYDPVNKIFSQGEFSEYEPNWGNWIWNIGELAKEKQRVKSAGVEDPDPMGTKLTGVNPQLYGKAQELFYAVDEAIRNKDKDYTKYLKSGAILKREDFTAFKTVVAQTKIIAKKPKRHIVLDLINVETVNEFTTKIYTFDGPWDMVQENLAELNVPNITGFPGFTAQTIGMERFAIHHAASEEFIAEQFDFNIRQFVIDNLSGQFDIVFNKKVADVLNNQSTFTLAGDWAAKTGVQSDRDPSEDINSEATKMDDTGVAEGMTIATNRKAYNAYQGNSYNTLLGTPSYKHPDYTFGNAVYTGIQHFTGLDWGVDSFVAAGKAWIFDPAAIAAYQMPERIVDYKSQYGTHIGTIIRKNFISKPIDTDRLLGLSGITV